MSRLIERMQHYVFPATVNATATFTSSGEFIATVTFTATQSGAAGNAVVIVCVSNNGVPGQAFSLVVVGTTITITQATDGGGIPTTTGNDVAAAIAGNPAAAALVNVLIGPGTGTQVFSFGDFTANLSGGTGAVGGSLQNGLSLLTDADAPFRLYGVVVWNLDVENNGGFEGQIALRFKRPDGRLIQKQLTSSNLLFPGNQYNITGLAPNKAFVCPIYPSILYPANSVITVDLLGLPSNVTTPPPGCIIVFVGCKIYEEGDIWAPKYPTKWRGRSYLNNLLIPNFNPLNGALLNQIFTTEQDADFVWQAGVYTDFAGGALPILFQTEGGSLSVQAVPGAPAGITIAFTTAIGANQPTSVAVIGNAITVTMSTDSLGGLNALTGALVSAINGSVAASALVTAALLGISASFQPFGATAIPAGSGAVDVCQLVDLGVIVRDWNYKAYSNGYVPAALLFPFLTAQMPGFLYPEIYIPKQQQISFDLQYLYPGFTPSANPVNVVLGLKGMKVYPQ